jgi:hypothetical protein
MVLPRPTLDQGQTGMGNTKLAGAEDGLLGEGSRCATRHLDRPIVGGIESHIVADDRVTFACEGQPKVLREHRSQDRCRRR